MNECQGNFEIRIIELEQKVAKIEKWQEKILKHESLVSDGTVDAVVFENNMLKAENTKLKQELAHYKQKLTESEQSEHELEDLVLSAKHMKERAERKLAEIKAKIEQLKRRRR